MDQIVSFLTQHWILSASFIVVLIIFLVYEGMSGRFGIQEISPQKVVQLINHQEAALVDIRPNVAFNEGHIAGSLSFPLAEIEQKMQTLQKYATKPLVLVCVSGQSALKLGTRLEKKGFKVMILAGGLQAWKTAGLPLVKQG